MLADAWGTELGIPEPAFCFLGWGWCCWVKVHDVMSMGVLQDPAGNFAKMK